jgi:nucleoside-diphosphate-sugar epimerase
MRILITGSNGFSGRHMVRALSARGHEIVALSRSAPAEPPPARGRHVRADLKDAARAIEGPFDAVVHAAATSPPPEVTVADLVRDNVEGTRALLDAAVLWKTRAFVLFSSVSVNGRVDEPVVDETTSVRDPDAYGASKLLCEAMLAERAGAFSGLSYRLPAIVGDGAVRNWLARSAASILRGETVRFYTPSGRFNNAIHIADVCALTALALEKGWTGHERLVPAARGMTTVLGALERLAAAIGRPLRTETIDALKPSFVLSGARATALFGHVPMDIHEVLDRYGGEIRTGAR